MLPAEQGDALFIEYGSARSPHRVLIDAGVRKTSGLVSARIAELPASKRHFDLLIVTHVDSDHIGGIPKLLADPSLGVTFDDVWFNGWRHLQPDRLGPVEGEIFSAQLDKRELGLERGLRREGRRRPPQGQAAEAGASPAG